MHLDVAHRIKRVEYSPKDFASAFDGQDLHRNLDAVETERRAAGDEDFDRLLYLAAAEFRLSLSPQHENLIDIVMENVTEPIEIISTQRDREVLRERVGERVWVADPFAFDDLERGCPGIGQRRGVDGKLHRSPAAQAMFSAPRLKRRQSLPRHWPLCCDLDQDAAMPRR